jgi:hypothetical protein
VAWSAQGCSHEILKKREKNGLVSSRCCHGKQKKGEKSDIDKAIIKLRRAATGYRGKERKVAWSAEGCCHVILRKGEMC